MKKIKSGAVILTIVLLLVFFSKTIYTWNLPHVKAVKPFRGTITKFEETQGTARWADSENIYAPLAGTVATVLVSEGDEVRAGQPLWTMDYGVEETARRLAETANSIAKAELEIESSRAKLRDLEEALSGVAQTPASGDGSAGDAPGSGGSDSAGGGGAGSGSVVPGAISGANLISLEIAQAQRELRSVETLFNAGYASESERDAARKNYQTVLSNYVKQRDDLRLTLRSRELDLDNLRLTEAAYQETLEDYKDGAVAVSSVNGVVQALNVEKGQYVQQNALLATIGRSDAVSGGDDHAFILDCPVPSDTTFIVRGDRCVVSNGSINLVGTVTRIQAGGQSKTVSVAVSSPLISAGDVFDVTFEKTSATVYTLVPSGVVYGSGSSAYVYQVKRRDGVMGKEYYVEKLNVYAGDADWQNTAIVRGLTFFDPLAVSSSVALSSGQTVLLDNPEDFFEN